MKQSIVSWGEDYFYRPNLLQKLLSYLLLPLSGIYCLIMYLRFKTKTPHDFNIPVISVGNLTLGGSGKTPLVTALAKHFIGSAIILRGYGRHSKGLYVVHDGKDILCDVITSGDEAMIYAKKLQNTIVIVSELREEGIEKAKSLGAKQVFLDDAYSKHHIKKLDLLLEVKTPNTFCLPSGAYRELLWPSKSAISVVENRDFSRRTELVNGTNKMALLTAIARPQRLDAYLPEVSEKYYFEDHHFFTREEVREIFEKSGADSLLVTYKDLVKMSDFNVPLSLLDLEVTIENALLDKIGTYIDEKKY